MRKIIPVLLIILAFVFLTADSDASIFKKKEKPYLVLSSNDIRQKADLSEDIKEDSVFRVNQRVYFYIYNPEGFKTDFIRYQIVKQDDNAFVGGYTRIRNITKRLSDKNRFSDYFVMTQKGKYFIQIFDLTNLHQWVAFGAFIVVED